MLSCCQNKMLATSQSTSRTANSDAGSRLWRSRRGSLRLGAGRLVVRAEAKQHLPQSTSRRVALTASVAGLMATSVEGPSNASVVGPAGDKVWEALGGGPPDLFFDDIFLGKWIVQSTLTKLDTPLGPDMVPDMRVVQRARQEDLDKPVAYGCAFVRNSADKVVMDRKYNTEQLLSFYMGNSINFSERIAWDMDNPNDMFISLPGGTTIETRTTRRSQVDDLAASRTETSEFFRQVYDTSSSAENKVKASQCFTKYKWRSRQEAGDGPVIVATQVVSDYLTPFDGEEKMIQAMNKAVVIYTYRMSFTPVA